MHTRSSLSIERVAGISAVLLVLALFILPVAAISKQATLLESSLNKFRSTAQVTLVYANDWDDVLPLFAGPNGTGGVRFGILHRVAAGWQTNGVHNTPQRIAQDSIIWANSILPYFGKTFSRMPWSQPGLPITQLPGIDYSQTDPTKTRHLIGLTYNGLLSEWSTHAVASPGVVPLYSNLMFKQNLDGLALSNPTLNCNVSGPCRFHPTQLPQTGAGGGQPYGDLWFALGAALQFTTWIYDLGLNFVSVDGSAYWRSTEHVPLFPNSVFDVNNQPFAMLDPSGPAGAPYWLTYCAAPGSTWSGSSIVYSGYYRPDSDYQWQTSECEMP